MVKSEAQASVLFNLRARWALFLLFGLIAIVAVWRLFSPGWPSPAGVAWAALAAAVFVAQIGILWSDLSMNVSIPDARLLPRFGPGTWLSLLRILALSMLVGFLWLPQPAGSLAWLPFALYLFYCLADLADGYAARVSGVVTRLGEKLDLELDGRGLLAATLLAFHYGTVGWWFLSVGLARYVFVCASWVHKRAGGKFSLGANSLRRPLAGAQMGFGVAFLAPRLPVEMTVFVSTLCMLPFLGNFLVDWLAGAGWLRRGSLAQRGQTWQTSFNWVLLALRVVLLTLLLLRVSSSALDIHVALDLFLGAVLALGLAGRFAAFGLLLAVGFRLQGQAVQAVDFAILFFAMWLLYLGTGKYSLRLMKEGWIFRRWGARPHT
ncbi:MAG: CDP-alcohol phosphatidyltransferase family protein [Anaerolineales bacterium]